MDASWMARMKDLEEENRRLKKMVSVKPAPSRHRTAPVAK